MIKEGKFGVSEAISLVVITITVKICFTSPGFVARIVGNASWYMTLVSMVTAMIGFTFIYMLLKRFPNKDLIEIFNIVLGPVIGRLFSVVLALFFIGSSAILLREFIEVIKIYALPLTPPSFVIGSFILTTITFCYLGLESLARFARLVAYFMLFIVVLIILMSFNNYNIHYLFPILGKGIKTTIVTGMMRSSYYDEVIILAIFAKCLQGTKYIKKVGYSALLISGIIISICLIMFNLIFSYNVLQELTSPMYVTVRMIKLSTFLNRLDPIFIFLWVIGTVVSINATFYCFLSTYAKAFKIQDIRPIIIPGCIVLFTFTILPKDFLSVASVYVPLFREYGWSVTYFLPLLTLIVAIIRRKKGEMA